MATWFSALERSVQLQLLAHVEDDHVPILRKTNFIEKFLLYLPCLVFTDQAHIVHRSSLANANSTGTASSASVEHSFGTRVTTILILVLLEVLLSLSLPRL